MFAWRTAATGEGHLLRNSNMHNDERLKCGWIMTIPARACQFPFAVRILTGPNKPLSRF